MMTERPWLRNYPGNWNLEYPDLSLYQLMKQSTAPYPDLIAIVFFGNEITFRELHENVDRIAAALLDLGINKGDRVALMLPNCPEYVYTFYACMKIGAIVVQLNPLYTPAELEQLLKDSGARVFVGVDAIFHTFHSVRERVAVEEAIVVRMMWTDVEGENLWFDELLQKYPTDSPEAQIDPQKDVAVLQYTGGTTGTPKAVMLTHFNLIANVWQVRESRKVWIEQNYGSGVTQKYIVAVLPLFHSFGMTGIMNYSLSLPAGQILLPRFEIETFLDVVDRYRPSIMSAVPTIYTAVVNYPGLDNYNIDSLEICSCGAAPLPLEIISRFEERTGTRILEGFGLTEASPVTHSNPITGECKPGSIGIPYSDTDCRIVDLDTGTTDLPPGEEGELLVKGPQVMKGYWNRPEETAETIRDGWLYTGDIAKMDEDGYFYIVDRKKDMVITGGFNIYPREVDEVLFGHPKVLEAVSAGIPDQYYGELLKAYVVLKDGESATQEELLNYCAEKMSSFMVPRSIEFRKELPKSAIGKILRRVLVEEEKKKHAEGQEIKQ